MIHHDAINDLRLVVIPAAGHQPTQANAQPLRHVLPPSPIA